MLGSNTTTFSLTKSTCTAAHLHGVALRATTARQVIRGVALVGVANVQAHSDRRAEKTAEAAKYDAFGPNHGGASRPFDFDCGRRVGSK